MYLSCVICEWDNRITCQGGNPSPLIWLALLTRLLTLRTLNQLPTFDWPVHLLIYSSHYLLIYSLAIYYLSSYRSIYLVTLDYRKRQVQYNITPFQTFPSWNRLTNILSKGRAGGKGDRMGPNSKVRFEFLDRTIILAPSTYSPCTLPTRYIFVERKG